MNSTTKLVLATLAVLATFLVLDSLWIGVLFKKKWANQISDIQGEPVQFRYGPAVLTYALMVLGVVALVVYPVGVKGLYISNTSTRQKVLVSLGIGAVLGAVMFGVFDGTNLVMFKKYKWSTAMMDIGYGMVVTALASMVGTLIVR
jgi:uncharacterized membrane protein